MAIKWTKDASGHYVDWLKRKQNGVVNFLIDNETAKDVTPSELRRRTIEYLRLAIRRIQSKSKRAS